MWLRLCFLGLLTVVVSSATGTGDEWSTVSYKRTTTTPSPAEESQRGWRRGSQGEVANSNWETNSGARSRSSSSDRRPSNNDQGSLRRTQSAPSLRQISDLKLQELSEELLARDVNNAAANVTFKRWQHGFIKMELTDEGSLRNRTTYAALENLKSFYNRDLLVAESRLGAKKDAEDAFLTAVMRTDVMKHLMNFLSKEGFLTANEQGQQSWMRTIWFTPYHRGKVPGGANSCGFEHIFLGETDSKLQKVDGMHNWFILFLEQNSSQVILKEKDSVEYKDEARNKVKGVLKKVSLTYNGYYKPSLTLAVGFSPELQMAYDTLCFLLRTDDRCALKVANKYFLIQNYSWYVRQLDKRVLASSFPEIDYDFGRETQDRPRESNPDNRNNNQRAPYRSRG